MDRIERLMAAQGTTWAGLARAVKKSSNAGSQWSGRRSFPREQTLYDIASQLGVAMGYLLSGDEPDEQRKAQTENELTALELLRAMTPAEQQAALAAMRGIQGSITKK